MFTKGYVPWNKGKTGIKTNDKGHKGFWTGKKLSLEHRKKLSESHKGQYTDNKHPMWKDNEVSYVGLHRWIRNKLGKIKECVYCGKEDWESRIEWASISHEAKRDLNDYIPLCQKCHGYYDRGYKTRKVALL